MAKEKRRRRRTRGDFGEEERRERRGRDELRRADESNRATRITTFQSDFFHCGAEEGKKANEGGAVGGSATPPFGNRALSRFSAPR